MTIMIKMLMDGGLSLLLREPAYKCAPKTSEVENAHTHNLVYTISITILPSKSRHSEYIISIRYCGIQMHYTW